MLKFLLLAATVVFLGLVFASFSFAVSIDATTQLQVTVVTPTPTPSATPTPTPTATPAEGGGGGGGPVTPPPAAVELKGLAYPRAIITVLRDAQLTGTAVANADGLFSFVDSGLSGGNYIYGLFAADTEGRKSSLVSFVLNVVAQSTTAVAGIIIPPTLSSANGTELAAGEDLIIAGQATPNSSIIIELLPEETIYQTSSQLNGVYNFRIPTGSLRTGVHTVRAKTRLSDGAESIFSEAVGFGVGVPYKVKTFKVPCGNPLKIPDFNCDGRINIIDLSIMIYWFNQKVPADFFADLNHDGLVDMADLSILVYYWTG